MKSITLLLLLTLILVSCSGPHPQPTLTPTPLPTATLASPKFSVTRVPDTQAVIDAFLQAWKDEDYAKMYGLLTTDSQTAISATDFEQRYRDVADSMTLKSIDYQVLSWIIHPASTQATYKVIFHTNLFGDITPESITMDLTLNNGAWQIAWNDGMIMPALKGGNKLRVDYRSPARGDIYDSSGNPLATTADAYALYVVPSELDPKQESTLLTQLSQLTGINRYAIQDRYENALPNDYVVIGEAPADAVKARMSVLSGLSGLRMAEFTSRYYVNNGISPQTVGYAQAIPAEELHQYERLGYSIGQKVGRSGLELWGEKYLAGVNLATLYVVEPKGDILATIGHTDSQPAQNITTTLDSDLQVKLQKSMGNYAGAIVVMERDSGKILAMVSTPGFDPNLLNSDNPMTPYASFSSNSPLLNRAIQGVYPLGSVFKIVTMSAALETGFYTPQSTYDCQYYFNELEGLQLHDWTLDYKVPASGLLTLPQGLMRSCDPFFWHIGLDLYNQGYTTAVSDMARGFGLGKATGFALGDQAGNISDPKEATDAVNGAIGQGDMLVTPLQVADFIAAVGNGGTLYQPQVVLRIGSADGDPTYTFAPIVAGKLPVSAANLQIVEDAMVSVIANPRGTAHSELGSMSIPVAGKTGTATTSVDMPHAWFAGYTLANNPNLPDIVVVVLVENAGEGSQVAAPIFRRAVSLYFSGGKDYGVLLPWESQPYVVASPTPEVTDTNTPAPTSPETETPTP